MADVILKSGTAPVAEAMVDEQYSRRFLTALRANLLLKQFGMREDMQLRSGTTVKWPRVERITTAHTTTMEGKDPETTALSINSVSAQLAEYKQAFRLSDLFQKTSVPRTWEEVMDAVAFKAAEVMDTRIRDIVFTAGGSGLLMSTKTHRSSLTQTAQHYIDLAFVREGARRLESGNVPTFGNGLYIALIHPDAKYDLQGDSTWQSFQQYTEVGVGRAYQGKIGTNFGVEFYYSTQTYKGTNKIISGARSDNLYQTYVFGQDYYGVSALTGLDIEIIMKNPAPASVLNSYGTVGYKFVFVPKELQAARLSRLEHTASAGA